MMLSERRLSNSVFHLKIYLCILTATLTSCSFPEPACKEPTRSDLIHYLLNEKRYDRNVPPDICTGSATDVSVQIIITDLNLESDLNMELEFTLYLRLYWTDERLNYSANMTCNNNTQNTCLDPLKLGDGEVEEIWIPDLYFCYERKSELHGLLKKNQLIYIYRNGSVVYSGRYNVKTHCQMNLQKYPFDTQICPFVIQSYSFTNDQILLRWNERSSVDIDAVDGIELEKHSITHTYDFNYPVGNFSILRANFTYRRQTESFEVMYIAPVIVLVLVSFTSFLLGDTTVPRFSVPTGSLTQLIVQWYGVNSKLPPSTVLPFLDRWMLANVIIVGLVLVVNAVLHRCNLNGQTRKTCLDFICGGVFCFTYLVFLVFILAFWKQKWKLG